MTQASVATGFGKRLVALFAAIDEKNTDKFLEFLSDDAVFRFGSAAEVQGHEAIRTAVDAFFASIASSKHSLRNVVSDGRSLACEGDVAYERLDGALISLPFMNMFELRGTLIEHYKIYIDIGPLYAA
jgi:limonene-1,2-epoxide hydrolase